MEEITRTKIRNGRCIGFIRANVRKDWKDMHEHNVDMGL